MASVYITDVIRAYKRAPLTFILNLAALTLGLLCFLAAWGSSAYWRSSDSHFEKSDRVEIIMQGFNSEAFSAPPEPLTAKVVARHLDTLRDDIEAVARFSATYNVIVRAGQSKANLLGGSADPDLLRIFNFDFVEGEAGTALSRPDAIILTTQAAQKLFGNARALGKTVNIDSEKLHIVTGVIALSEKASHFGNGDDAIQGFDFITPYTTLPEQADDVWYSVSAFTYVLLADGSDRSAFRASLSQDLEARVPEQQKGLGLYFEAVSLGGLTPHMLDLRLFQGSGPLSVVGFLYLFGAVILLISCLNYTNLSIAQATRQAREIGMRKVLGASGRGIFIRCVVEGIFIAALAALSASVLLWIFGPAFEGLTGINLRAGLFRHSNLLWMLVLVIPGLGLAASLYPAIFMLGVAPARTLRSSTVKGGSPLLRNILVGVQFFAASLLLILLLVVSAQNRHLSDLAGPDAYDTVVMLTDSESRSVGANRLRPRLEGLPGIEAVSALGSVPWTNRVTFSSFDGEAGEASRKMLLRSGAGYGLCDVFACRLVAGSDFDPARHAANSDVKPVIIDTDTVRSMELGTPEQASGRSLYSPPSSDGTQTEYRIAGVIEPLVLNFGATSLQPFGQIYILDPDEAGVPAVRIRRGEADLALRSVEQALAELAPDAVLETRFVSDSFADSFRIYGGIAQGVSALSLTAFAIALLGLFGMASFLAARRRHEIGVRKTLGAQPRQIVGLLLRDFLKPILLANILASPVAWMAARAYLSGFQETVPLTPTPWVIALITTLLLGSLAVGGQAFRAASVSPTLVLRHD